MKTLVTFTVQKTLYFKNEDEFEKKLDELTKKLENEFENVSLEDTSGDEEE